MDAIYGNLFQDFNNFKDNLLKAGEEYYTKTLAILEKKIESLDNKRRSFQETIGLETLGTKKHLLISADLSLILKLQYL